MALIGSWIIKCAMNPMENTDRERDEPRTGEDKEANAAAQWDECSRNGKLNKNG